MFGTYCVDGVAEHIGRTTAELVGDWDPEEVPYALHEGRRGEEVGDFADGSGEVCWVDHGVCAGKEAHGRLDNGDGWAGGEEIAHEHRETDDCCDVPFLPLRPVQRIIGILRRRGNQNDLVRVVVTEADIAQGPLAGNLDNLIFLVCLQGGSNCVRVGHD